MAFKNWSLPLSVVRLKASRSSGVLWGHSFPRNIGNSAQENPQLGWEEGKGIIYNVSGARRTGESEEQRGNEWTL